MIPSCFDWFGSNDFQKAVKICLNGYCPVLLTCREELVDSCQFYVQLNSEGNELQFYMATSVRGIPIQPGSVIQCYIIKKPQNIMSLLSLLIAP